MSIVAVETQTLGEGWLAVSRAILEDGAIATYDGQTTRELALLTLVVAAPSSDDEVIARLGDPEWLAWMHDNFFDHRDVPELGNAKSYAARLFDYAGSGRDQLAWVVDRLRADSECRSATITTFQPLTDTSYVPCVSMLDFWLRDGAVELVVYAHSLDFGKKAYGNLVELVVYAHSLDFGKKAYGNLVELARLQEHVGARLGAATGSLVVHAKSAHVYEPEWSAMASIASAGDVPTLR
jgi:thymidylate synthase